MGEFGLLDSQWAYRQILHAQERASWQSQHHHEATPSPYDRNWWVDWRGSVCWLRFCSQQWSKQRSSCAIVTVAADSFQGPAALLLAFGIIGIMIFNVVYALGELAVVFPVSGGFYTYSTRFIDPSWGFAMGWNYVFQWAIVLPLELTVAGLTVEYWGAGVSVGVWITVFWLIIIFINVFGTLGYAEEEFWSSLLKLAAIVLFMIIGIAL